MHELSIVAALIELCEDSAREQNATKIGEIYTKIGDFRAFERPKSGVGSAPRGDIGPKWDEARRNRTK